MARLKAILSRLLCLGSAAWLLGCSAANFDLPGAGNDASAYAALYPTFAEYCALSQIKKRPGFGAEIRGEIGGHAVFYLNGACRVQDAGYPVLEPCRGDAEDGVGLSMNAHFRNAKWVAIPGRSFFFDGAAAEPTGLTRAGYARTQARAKQLGLYRGVVFHDEVFRTMPAGWSREEWQYEVSVATDYAVAHGRGRFCAKVPVTRAQMARMIAFLNDQNAPYRAGQVFRWDIIRDNCIHLAHNALAAAGLWAEWPINQFLGFAVFDFPVPRNEFVDLMRRTNESWLPDPGAAYDDPVARGSLLAFSQLPTRPGALAEVHPPLRPNAVYETEGLKLIFYEEPLLGRYRSRSTAILGTPAMMDLRANRMRFDRLAQEAEAARRPLAWWVAHGYAQADFPAVYAAYYRAITAQRP